MSVDNTRQFGNPSATDNMADCEVSIRHVSELMSQYCNTPGVADGMMDSLIRETEAKISLVQTLSLLRVLLPKSANETLAEERNQTDVSKDLQSDQNGYDMMGDLTKETSNSEQKSIVSFEREEGLNPIETTDNVKMVEESTISHSSSGDAQSCGAQDLLIHLEGNEAVTENNAKTEEPSYQPRSKFRVSVTQSTGDKEYHCLDCDFTTNHIRNLNGHLLSRHNKSIIGLKTYLCSFCAYKCADKQRLVEHEAKHSGKKTFQCGECQKSFSTKRGLRIHLKYKNSNKSHQCGHCKATFKAKAKLQEHVRVLHTNKGEKPYRCGYCDHRASIRGNVNQHIKAKHKGKPYLVIRQSVGRQLSYNTNNDSI